MSRRRLIGLLLGASLWTSSSDAQERRSPILEITHERALEMARERAPTLVTARARVGEARSRVDAASAWPFNPQLQGSAGPRFGPADTQLDWSVGAQQEFELGGQRGDRLDAARAGVEASRAQSDDVQRLLLRDVSIAFVEALYWDLRVGLAEDSLRIAEAIEQVARRRHEVGDVGALDQSVATLSLARAQTSEARARAALEKAKGRLKILLGIEGGVEIAPRGDLRRLGIAPSSTTEVDARPDLRALRAEIREAEAEADLGRAGRVPNVALGASYSREESADILQGALAITIPVFERGQGTTAMAEARRGRAKAELRAARRQAAVEVDTLDATARQLGAAARRFEAGGLTTLERVEQLATASYEAGAIPLGELLAVRREFVQARLDYADLLLGAATAHAELAASTGALR